MTRPGRAKRLESGATVVEFALVFGLVVLPLVFGVIQYGYHYWSLETAAATAREAARRLAVGTEYVCVTDAGVRRAITWDEEVRRQAGNPAVGAVAVTPNGRGAYDPTLQRLGGMVTVTVSFDSLHVGFLPLPGGGRVTESAVARIHNVPKARQAAPAC
ncbi:TadE/TadG family type IV pilus assembly protein [Nocardioides abyssi]|uniref:TadE/TadG family type IV pilus assembly protein n=1 Tax=Nocardioides abyssi TaxID=3058370 RepID=A0ABT8ER73_9ACTN|nr:TadE/TadG family type IV pilus assembly protein [Nocardioides abyssi]MDN4160619.1 TadE/TadG family type IV pilus assembly protein [Nocardioides abyssi]